MGKPFHPVKCPDCDWEGQRKVVLPARCPNCGSEKVHWFTPVEYDERDSPKEIVEAMMKKHGGFTDANQQAR